MSNTTQSTNKALVLEAFDTLFNRRDYAAAERFWSPHYIQHSAHIEPGREGLFNLIKSIPPTLKYQPGTIVAEGDYLIVHGRFSGFGSRSTGSPPIFSELKTASSSSIGT
ncbi:MAG TPA: nuclear transport factor 2 family protein [Bryobacteraceae bacterium]|nr:nuclear transport factor 2 family protein [Bryobacteraceae bacterium]